VGVDYLIPDWSILQNPTHLLLTHGHEDHIGAVAHLVKDFPKIIIHAAPFTAALVEKKLAFFDLKAHIEVWHDEPLTLGDLQITPVKVNHSIPQTRGFLITDLKATTPWCLFYISDFKIDLSGQAGTPFDLAALQAQTKDFPVRILLADSTNHLGRDQSSLQEGDLYLPLKNIINQHDGRVFVALFASNIYRLQTLTRIAQETSRTVIPYGRSINTYLHTAQELGLLAEDLPIQEEHFNPLNPKNLVLLSGPQGDLRGALRRVASGESPFKLGAQDAFIFSSKIIPGNERRVHQIINRLAEQKCRIYYPHKYTLHASGHATQEDFATLLKAFAPTDFFPIHGESYLLQEHYDFVAQNFPAIRPYIIHNFDQIEINPDGQLAIQHQEGTHPLFIAGNTILEKEAVSERRKMGTNGVIFLTLEAPAKTAAHYSFLKSLTKRQRKRENAPRILITMRGLPLMLQEKIPLLQNALAQKWMALSPEESTDELIFFTKRWAAQIIGYRPEVVAHFSTTPER